MVLKGLSMCTCPTKSGKGVNTVGEEHPQMWHVINVHKCVFLGERIQGLNSISRTVSRH